MQTQLVHLVPASFVALYRETGRKPLLLPVSQNTEELVFHLDTRHPEAITSITLHADGTWTVEREMSLL